jgi:hypothetical protein
MRVLIVICMLLAGDAALAAPGYADHYQAALGAYRAGDNPAFLEAARAARAMRPDSPQAAYLLAAAEASNGNPAQTLVLLRSLADQGLSFDPGAEPAFATIELPQLAPDLLDRLLRNGQAQGEAVPVFRLDEDRFIPEGLAWDAQSGRYFLGSIHQRRILAVGADGQAEEFVAEGAGGLLSVFGMRAVADTRSLWVATAGLRETRGIAATLIGVAGILEFNLDTGELRRAFWLPKDDADHVLGDLELVEGGLLTTDSASGAVLQLGFASGEFISVVPPGRLVSPQGLVRSDDPRFVYLADYRSGIFRLDLTDGALVKLTGRGTTHHGIDGLYRNGRWLVAIQNGIQPNRVVALQLDDVGTGVSAHRVIAAALPEFDEPNLGTIVDGQLHFVANSHWPRFDAEGELPAGLSGPIVLAVDLP